MKKIIQVLQKDVITIRNISTGVGSFNEYELTLAFCHIIESCKEVYIDLHNQYPSRFGIRIPKKRLSYVTAVNEIFKMSGKTLSADESVNWDDICSLRNKLTHELQYFFNHLRSLKESVEEYYYYLLDLVLAIESLVGLPKEESVIAKLDRLIRKSEFTSSAVIESKSFTGMKVYCEKDE